MCHVRPGKIMQHDLVDFNNLVWYLMICIKHLIL